MNMNAATNRYIIVLNYTTPFGRFDLVVHLVNGGSTCVSRSLGT